MQRSIPLLAVGVLLAVVLGAFTPIGWLAAWLVGLGLTTFVVYGWDKRQAQSGGWRVPEIVLHSLALAGGVVGGWAGRQVFRHKTRKPVFTVVLTVATALWAVIAFLVVT